VIIAFYLFDYFVYLTKQKRSTMNTELNINKFENKELRNQILELTNEASSKDLSKWALMSIKHAYNSCGIDYEPIPYVIEGFLVLDLYLRGMASLSDIRREAFQMEKYTRQINGDAEKLIALSQGASCAVGTPVIIGKSLACSDYCIKAIWFDTSKNEEAIKRERLYQIQILKAIIKRN
jgi:hypothetical protein